MNISFKMKGLIKYAKEALYDGLYKRRYITMGIGPPDKAIIVIREGLKSTRINNFNQFEKVSGRCIHSWVVKTEYISISINVLVTYRNLAPEYSKLGIPCLSAF